MISPTLVITEVDENVSTPSSRCSAIKNINFASPSLFSRSALKVEPIITDSQQTDSKITGYLHRLDVEIVRDIIELLCCPQHCKCMYIKVEREFFKYNRTCPTG